MVFLLVASFPSSLLVFRGALLKELNDRGVGIHVAAPGLREDTALCEELESLGYQAHDIPLSRVGMNPLADGRTLWHLWRLMRKVKPDTVLAYTIKPVIYGLLAARLAGIGKRFALITGLGYSFQEPNYSSKARVLLRLLVQRLYAFSLRGASNVFFQNPDDRQLFRERGLISRDANSVVVNGSGVDISKFNVVPLPAQMTFLLIARLLGDKGVREYAAAAQRVRAANPNVAFNLVGWIDDNPDAIDKAELDTWISDGTLNYLGRMGDVRPAIAASSVYVLPSYREGTPRTVLEAMAMGRPIITTNAPGCRETVQDGLNGYLVAVKSVDELASAMLHFVNTPERVKSMGQAARELAVEKYDVDKVNQMMLREMHI
ncbi:glycosyltransferase family 4 protein [Pseudomonas qingdaonensis]|uniref:glycosyltransferase family 4 protein n=1 Tax=Pseudomonas qingdaonensis TaxID=2056231 RepID=UPI001F31485D|nr:glycosyltransferase family 4 protein [Pseudomonas qingdaonensis]